MGRRGVPAVVTTDSRAYTTGNWTRGTPQQVKVLSVRSPHEWVPPAVTPGVVALALLKGELDLAVSELASHDAHLHIVGALLAGGRGGFLAGGWGVGAGARRPNGDVFDGAWAAFSGVGAGAGIVELCCPSRLFRVYLFHQG